MNERTDKILEAQVLGLGLVRLFDKIYKPCESEHKNKATSKIIDSDKKLQER